VPERSKRRWNKDSGGGFWRQNATAGRSNTNFVVFAQLSGHATARLIERRRGVDLERLLAEELSEGRLVQLIEAGIEKKVEEMNLSTTNGAFRFRRGEEGTLVALTWISAGPER